MMKSARTISGQIECINPKEKKGRIYRITKEGEKVIKVIEEMEE